MTQVPVEQGCAATPAAQLRDRIMNPCVAKSEAEWWAARRIEKLEEDAAHRIAAQAELVEALESARVVLASGEVTLSISIALTKIDAALAKHAPAVELGADVGEGL